MRRNAIIGGLLLIAVGIILGATVFRTDLAQATGLAQSVTVTNTPAQAVPVREQNLAGGNIKVHEQGTVNVQGTVGIGSLSPATRVESGGGRIDPRGSASVTFAVLKASTLVAQAPNGDVSVQFRKNGPTPPQNENVITVFVKDGETVSIPLLQTVEIDAVGAGCNPFDAGCVFEYTVIGN
jgi:hypothetical protein